MNGVAMLYVGFGGALGALARYALTMLLPRSALPLGTLVSNLAGCLLMGVTLQWLAQSDWFADTQLAREPYRLLLAVGFCGSFTTLSALVFEMSAMLQRSEIAMTFGYIVATLAGGFLCFYAGVLLARALANTG